jgi:hypothetical protein
MLESVALWAVIILPAVLAFGGGHLLGHRRGHRCQRSSCWVSVGRRVGRHGYIGVSKRL